MAYNNNIPQPTDIKSQSQSQILGNFQALSSFGNGYCDLPVQSTQPAPAGTLPLSSGFDNAIYSFTNTTTGLPETYLHNQTLGSTSGSPVTLEVPMTASVLGLQASSVNLAGWAYLPSGILIKWGNEDISSSNTNVYVDVDSISGGPAFSKIFNVQVTPYFGTTTNPLSAGVLSPINAWTGTSIGMWVNSSSGPASGKGVQYFVIGV